MVTTTIYVKPYLAAYMYVRYQNSVVTELNAIRLKSIENLYHVIKNLTVKRPRDVSWRETGNLTLIIPTPRYGKEPETYNYLGHNSVIIIEEEIETMLKTELHSIMLRNKFRNGIMYKKSLLLFSRPLKSILLSDIQQYNYQTSIVNLQVFVSLGIETCRFL